MVPRAVRSADKTLRSGAAAPTPHSCRDPARHASPRHDRSVSPPVVPGRKCARQRPRWWCPGPACGWPGRRRQPPCPQYCSTYGITAGSRQCIRRALRAGQIRGAQKAGGPRPAVVPGAAAPPPQQASGRWRRRAGPASRRPGGTCPGFGPDGPLADRTHARVPCARRAAAPPPSRGDARFTPAMRPLRRPGGRRRRLSRNVGRAPGSPGPLRLAETCQDAPPGRRPPARSPVGRHQGAAHWQSRRWH